MSNQILEFTAVVTDPVNPSKYGLRKFSRGESDAKVFLTQLGRALLVDATLQVVPNYNLRCQSFTNFSDLTVFAKPNSPGDTPKDSFGDYLNRCGRVRSDLVSHRHESLVARLERRTDQTGWLDASQHAV